MSTKQTLWWAVALVIAVPLIASQIGKSDPNPNRYAQESALEEVCAKQLRETEHYGSRAEYRLVVGACEQAKAKIRSGQ